MPRKKSNNNRVKTEAWAKKVAKTGKGRTKAGNDAANAYRKRHPRAQKATLVKIKRAAQERYMRKLLGGK